MGRRSKKPGRFNLDRGLRVLGVIAAGGLLVSLYFLLGPERPLATELVVGTDHSPPFQVVLPDGRITGAVVEALNLSAREAGIRLHWKHFDTRPDDVLSSEEHGVDLWPMVTVSEERKQRFHLTQPIGRAEYQIAIIDDGKTELRGYQPRKVAITRGAWMRGRVEAAFPGTEPVFVRAGGHLEALCDGRADALIADAASIYSMSMEQMPVCAGKRIVNRLLADWYWDLAIGSTFARAAEADRLRAEFGKLAREGALNGVFEDYPLQAQYRSHDTFAETRWERVARTSRIALIAMCVSCIALLLLVLASRRRVAAALTMVRQKSEFLDRISHELRTPLNGVLGLASLMATTPLSPLQRDYLRLIRHSGEELLKLVSDLLDFSRLEAKKQAIQMEPVNLRALVEDTVATLAPIAQARKIDLAWVVARGVPEYVMSDGRAVRQVLTNLIANALKYTPEGRVRVSMEIAGEETNFPFIHCCVDDSGPGIPKGDRSRVFDSFVRLDRDTDRAAVGTGLGLTIARELVLLMHGNIGVTESPFGGARFWFEFPAPRPETLPGQSPATGALAEKAPGMEGAWERIPLRRVHVVSLRPTQPAAQRQANQSPAKQNPILRLVLKAAASAPPENTAARKEPVLLEKNSSECLEMLIQYLRQQGAEVFWSPSLEQALRSAAPGAGLDLLIIGEETDSGGVATAVDALRKKYRQWDLPAVVFRRANPGGAAETHLALPFTRTLPTPFVSSRFDHVVAELVAEAAQRLDDGSQLRALRQAAGFSPSGLSALQRSDLHRADFYRTETEDTASEPEEDPGGTATEEEGTEDAAGLHVLLADDNKVNQVVLAAMLRKLGITCDVVFDGREALEACEEKRYDYVFLDHHMPNLNGLEAAEELRKRNDWRKDVPIIICSAADPHLHQESYRAVGISATLTKPFTIHELRAALNRKMGATAGAAFGSMKGNLVQPPGGDVW